MLSQSLQLLNELTSYQTIDELLKKHLSRILSDLILVLNNEVRDTILEKSLQVIDSLKFALDEYMFLLIPTLLSALKQSRCH